MLLIETCYYWENQGFGGGNIWDMSLFEMCFCLRLYCLQEAGFLIGFRNQTSGKQIAFFCRCPQGQQKRKFKDHQGTLTLDQTNKKTISISSDWNQICRHLIMLVAATTLSSLMWKPCFFPQMPPGTTKKKIQPLRLFFSFLSTALCHQKFFSPSLSVLLKNYNTVHFIVHSTQNC